MAKKKTGKKRSTKEKTGGSSTSAKPVGGSSFVPGLLESYDQIKEVERCLEGLNLEGDRSKEALTKGRPIAYEAGERVYTETGMRIFSENGQDKLEDSEIQAGLENQVTHLIDGSAEVLASNIDKILQEIDEDKFEEIAQNREIQINAGEEYQREVVGEYARYRQAKRLMGKKDTDLTREEKGEIFSATGPIVAKELSKKLHDQGKSMRYIQSVLSMAQASARTGNLDPSFLKDSRTQYLKEREDELKKSGVAEKGREYVAKVVQEGDVQTRASVLKTLHEAYNPLIKK